jgi:hypothetical protein
MGLSYKFGINLAKRQVFAEQKLEDWATLDSVQYFATS